MSALDIATVAGTIGLTLGVWFGQWSASRRWAAKGDNGYPRMYFAGRLYWVNRDDKPCFRCAPLEHDAGRGEGQR